MSRCGDGGGVARLDGTFRLVYMDRYCVSDAGAQGGDGVKIENNQIRRLFLAYWQWQTNDFRRDGGALFYGRATRLS